MKISAAVLTVFLLAAEGSAQPLRPQAGYELTKIPFDVNQLTDKQRAVIQSGHAADNSSYLIQSRPVLFQIVETGNHADEVRDTGPIDQKVDVLIYALGEANEKDLVDYAWIEHVDTGKTVWKMTSKQSMYAGGDRRNRKAVAGLTLEPGAYRLRYVSNSAHAYPDWQGAPPERPRFYGVTVFNMTALPRIEARLKQANVPSLKTSLKPQAPQTPGSP